MTKYSDSAISDLAQVHRSKAQIDAEIERLKQLPEQLRQEQHDRMNTLPPSDLIEHRIRQNEYDKLAGRGEIGNVKREVTRHLWVMLLLLIAVVAMVWWAYRSMERYGFL